MAQVTKETIDHELAQLEALSSDQLRTKWEEVYGSPLKGGRRSFLIRGIAYRLREIVYGGLSAATKRQLKMLAQQFARNPDYCPPLKTTLSPGTVLFKAWREEVHEVTVLDKGFRYRDHVFSNLSQIARQITGTRWSGPLFFGLKKQKASGNARKRGKVASRRAPYKKGRSRLALGSQSPSTQTTTSFNGEGRDGR